MNIDKDIEGLINGQLIPEHLLFEYTEMIKDVLFNEPNVVPVQSPVVVCGDVHGQFYDVLEIFKLGGTLEETSYIFIGDFVDRGYNSVETFELLMLYKIKYPSRMTLLRGNHECRQITMTYGFLDEINKKYGNPNPWTYFMEVFDLLPLGALVDNKILTIHGGLSPDIRTIDQIRAI